MAGKFFHTAHPHTLTDIRLTLLTQIDIFWEKTGRFSSPYPVLHSEKTLVSFFPIDIYRGGHGHQSCQNKHPRKYIIGTSCNTRTAPRSRSWRSHLTDYNGNWKEGGYSSRMSDSQTGKDDASTIAHYLPTFSSSNFSAHKGQLLVGDDSSKKTL